MADASLSVLLAHDDRLELFGLARALDDEGVQVVGEAHTREQVAALLARTRPDVLVVAVELIDDAELLAAIGRHRRDTRVIVVSTPAGAARAWELCGAGADGFLSNAVEPRDLPTLLRVAAAGTFYFPPPRPSMDECVEPALTEREVAVLRGAARGLSNEAIGRELWLSPHTVKSHLHRIYGKLDVANRTEAARWALDNRLLDAEMPVAV